MLLSMLFVFILLFSYIILMASLEELAALAAKCETDFYSSGNLSRVRYVVVRGGNKRVREEFCRILQARLGGENGYFVYPRKRRVEDEFCHNIDIDELLKANQAVS